MLIAWVVSMALSLVLFLIQGCSEKFTLSKANRIVWIYFAAFSVFTIVFCNIAGKAVYFCAIPATLGVGLFLRIIAEAVRERDTSWISTLIMISFLTLSITFISYFVSSEMNCNGNAKIPKTKNYSNEKAYSNSNGGQGTGTNKHPVDENCVYWVPKGGVWHSWEGCSSLRDSDIIYSGTIYEAEEAGKERGCKLCTDY